MATGRSIVLAPIGSRGDVQPMLALALGLRARGHAVTIAAPANFAAWVEGFGLPFAPVGPDIEAQVRRFGERAHATRDQMRILREELVPHQFEALPAICRHADLIVGAGLQVAGPSVAAALDIPYAFVGYAPVVIRSAHHPPPVVRVLGLPGWVNRLAWSGFGLMIRLTLAGSINRGRAALGLAPVRDVAGHLSAFPIVLAADTALTGDVPDLPPSVRRVPALRLSDDGRLPEEVRGFLEEGAPPVLVGFGSMVTDRARELMGLFIEASAESGVRLLVQTGWTGLSQRVSLPATHCRLVGPLSHQALLPRVRAAVHHGGAGTTATVTRAGKPQLVVPHLLDQFYWAHRVHALGLGPRPVPVWRVRRVRSLALLLERLVTREEYARRARDLAGRIAGDGLDQAVAILERL